MNKKQVVERIEVQEDSLFYHEHLARYRFAASYLRPGWTLDIASGTGYGAQLLTEQAGIAVVAADLNWPSLTQARQTYPSRQIYFMEANGMHLPFADACFQNIVTLETLEHIPDDHGYVSELARVLRPDGVCVLSTPNRAYSLSRNRVNPYHVREYVEDELRTVLHRAFTQVHFFYQGFAERYHAELSAYSAAIQASKRQLNPMKQFLVNRIYRPLKKWAPSSIVNYFIQRWLKLFYPQPALADVIIAETPPKDLSVFVVVCREPRRPY